MSPIMTSGPLSSLGHPLNPSAESFGWLADSYPDDDLHALREYLDREGYLYLRGVLDQEHVCQAKERLLAQLHERGMLLPGTEISNGIARTPWVPRSCHDLIHANEPLQRLLFSGRMLEMMAGLLDAPVRHFDFTWIRVMGPGRGTAPHADSVYMNRGTPRLFTAWTPLMDIPLEIGGLMIMPRSHRLSRLKKYHAADVDTYCENRPPRQAKDTHGWIGPIGDGKLSENPARLQQRLNLPWLTSRQFLPGDVLLFSLHTLHASLDNHSDRVRLSTDTRYQRRDEPADPRWVGPNPTGHAASNRRGLIC